MTRAATEAAGAGSPGWRPRLVALDIDGTLLRWIEGSGQTSEEIRPRVHAAVGRALDAGAHVVLASGRSPHGMANVADLLDLRGQGDEGQGDEGQGDEGQGAGRQGAGRQGAERAWAVASNGAVVFRYPPLEIVHEETFDASDAVREVLTHVPDALVAVEERGVGYRVNRPFPRGELSGDMIEAHVDDLVGEPVSRVIIRDPDSTPEDFLKLASKLGLHGTDYVVGWTAWLDLQPVGVTKASGLEHAATRLGVGAGEVLAIGDGRNDLEMLRWAGRGVAMGQAVDEVRAAADDVTATVDDDGAAGELERWFPAGLA